MTGYRPVQASSADLGDALAWVMQGAYGWSVVTDPLDDVTLNVTPEEARALGDALQNGDLPRLFDTPAERQRLHEMLGVIAGDPALSAEFFANFDRVADLANALGQKRYDLSVDARLSSAAADDLAQVDQIIADLAAAYQSQPAHASPASYPTVIDTMDPYAAALFVQHLRLDPTVLAAAADDISVRTLAWDDDRVYAGNGVDTPADILFRSLCCDTAAAAAYLQLAVDYPHFLVHYADNQALAEQVMVLGTDPRYVSPDDAGLFVVPFTQFVLYDDDWIGPVYDDNHRPTTFVGSLAGPWLAYFTARADEWPWSVEHSGRAVLKDIIRDDSAMILLVQALDRFREQVMQLPLIGQDGTLNEQQLEVVATVIATLRVDLRDETNLAAVTAAGVVEHLAGQSLGRR